MGSWPISVGPQESHTHSAGFKDGAVVPDCVGKEPDVMDIKTVQPPGEQGDAGALAQQEEQGVGSILFSSHPVLFFIFCFAALGSNLGIFPCSICPFPPSHLPVIFSLPAEDRVLASALQPEV